jgi:hypothetical protein
MRAILMTGDVSDKPVRYPLFSTEGRRAMVLRFRDEGVEPGVEGVSFIRDGATQTLDYDDLRSVRLSTNLAGRSPVGACRLDFANGPPLTVMSCAASGLGDPSRAEAYRQFIADLHHRIIAAGAAAHVAFNSGYSGTRRGILIAALVAAVALLVVLPLVLLVVTREPRTLIVAIAGMVLFYPAWRVARTNRPTTYRPDDPPDLLG